MLNGFHSNIHLTYEVETGFKILLLGVLVKIRDSNNNIKQKSIPKKHQ